MGSELPGVRCVEAGNPSAMTLGGTRVHLVGRRRVAIVDPGPVRRAHLDRLAAAVAASDSAVILLTHGHADHAGGAAELARRIGADIRDPSERLGPPLREGERVETDAGDLLALPTPGHTPEHTAYRFLPADASGEVVFVGDLLMGEGDTALVAAPEGDVAAYLESLDRVEALGPRVLVPAHGPVLRDPAAAVDRFREHRLRRVEQVRAALGRLPGRPLDALREAVYGDSVPPGLVPAANASLQAILDYLPRGDPAHPDPEYDA